MILHQASPAVPKAVVVSMSKLTWLQEELEDPRTPLSQLEQCYHLVGGSLVVPNRCGIDSLTFSGSNQEQAASQCGSTALGHGASVSAGAVSPGSAPEPFQGQGQDKGVLLGLD